jgi:hypothetical protein
MTIKKFESKLVGSIIGAIFVLFSIYCMAVRVVYYVGIERNGEKVEAVLTAFYPMDRAFNNVEATYVLGESVYHSRVLFNCGKEAFVKGEKVVLKYWVFHPTVAVIEGNCGGAVLFLYEALAASLVGFGGLFILIYSLRKPKT